MRKKTSLNRRMFTLLTVSMLFFAVIVGCKKNSITTERIHEETIEQYKSTLYLNNDFIENFKLDKIITSFNRNKNLIIDETKNSSLFLLLEKSKSLDELTLAFSSHGYTNSSELVRLLNLKASALLNVKKKFPYLSKLTKEEFYNLFVYSYKKIVVETMSSSHSQGCTTNCCDAYVDGMSDCDLDFAIATGFSLLAGGVAAVFGTPIAGAVTVSSGIGAAYLMHERCSATTARTYRQCMGYPR